MKADAAAAGIKNGGSQQVVQVYQHGQQQDDVAFYPVSSKENPGDDAGKDQVQKIMYQLLHEPAKINEVLVETYSCVSTRTAL